MKKNEDNNIIKEKATFFNIDNIPRCPECNLISSFKLIYKESKPIINYCCENNHNGEITLEEYMQKYNDHSLLKEKCGECNKNQSEVKGEFFYCCKCDKFLCNSCLFKHPNRERHNTINYNRYDSFCKIHSNFFDCYCMKCKKNICIYCKPNHKTHELIDLSEYNYSEESKKKLEENIKNYRKEDNRFRYNKRRNNIRNR